MTDEEVANLGESDPEDGGAVVQPKQDVSPAKDIQHSPNADNLVEILKTDPEFKAYVESIFQPWKDRRLDKHEKRLDSFESQLAEFEALKKEGWSDAQAKRLMKLGQDVLQEEPKPVSQPESPGKTKVETRDYDADGILRKQGIDPNSAEGVEIIRKSNNANDLIANVIEWKTKPVKQTPTAASSMPDGMGASVPARSLDVVQQELAAAMSNPKGLDFNKIRELEEESLKLIPTKHK